MRLELMVYYESISADTESQRGAYLKKTVADKVDYLLDIVVSDWAVKYIRGLSLEGFTQQEYESIGGRGLKPVPFTFDKKIQIYNQITRILKEQLRESIKGVMEPVIRKKYTLFATDTLKCLSENPIRFGFPNFASFAHDTISAHIRLYDYEIDPDHLKGAIYVALFPFIDSIYTLAGIQFLIYDNPPTPIG